jgi:hypothetical protein
MREEKGKGKAKTKAKGKAKKAERKASGMPWKPLAIRSDPGIAMA